MDDKIMHHNIFDNCLYLWRITWMGVIMCRKILSPEKEKKTIQGSYTVEAAFVMPIVILIIAALIYMAMYLHDKCSIKSVIDSTIVPSVLIVKHETESEFGSTDYERIDDRGIFFPVIGNCDKEKDKIKNFIQKKMEKGLFIAEIENIQVEANQSDILIRVSVKMKIALLAIIPFFNRDETFLVISGKGHVHYPAEFVRKLDAVNGILSNIEGYEKVMQKMQKLFMAKERGKMS